MAKHVFSLLGLAIEPREIASLKIEPKRFVSTWCIVSGGSTQAIGPQERLFKLDE
jgi:hypothetical protein